MEKIYNISKNNNKFYFEDKFELVTFEISNVTYKVLEIINENCNKNNNFKDVVENYLNYGEYFQILEISKSDEKSDLDMVNDFKTLLNSFLKEYSDLSLYNNILEKLFLN